MYSVYSICSTLNRTQQGADERAAMTMKPRFAIHQYRHLLWISVITFIPLGYVLRFYGPEPAWFKDALGSIAYEMFWIAVALGLWPRYGPARVATLVCIATCGLEVLQLWHPPFLQALRTTLPGRLILGTTFSWSDFPAYGIGSALGYGWVSLLARWSGAIATPPSRPFPKP